MQLNQDEAERLAALANYGILDDDFDESFDCITRLCANVYNTSISFVNLIDRNRQWTKASYGCDLKESRREDAFCNCAIQQTDVFVVPDARKSDFFKDNPFVTEDPHIVFYAGAPLITPEGFALGSLCVIDSEPRPDLEDADWSVLQDFGHLVVCLLEQRKELRMLRRKCYCPDELP